MTREDVQHDTGRMDVVGQGLGTGRIDGVQAIAEHGGEDFDHLPVTTGLPLQLALHAPDRNRQVPLLEWRAIAQSPRFAGRNGYVMQGIVDGVVAPEDTFMATDDPAVLPAFEPISIGPDLDGPPHGAGIDRVSVLVEPHEAGLGYRRRHGVEAVEGTDVRNKARALFFEHVPDRPVPHLRMCVGLGIRPTSILQPGVQFGIGFELRPRHVTPQACFQHDEPSPDHPHLVLDLSLLPTRRGRAGDRVDEIVPTHLLKATIVGPVLADEDRVHRGLRVHCPRTNGGQFPLS